MTNIPMKKILITLNEKSLERLDKIVEILNKKPEEGGGWNRSRLIRIIIHKEWKNIGEIWEKKNGTENTHD